MRTVSFAALKGGVGKTMVSLNVAAVLSEAARVLLIDCDPQGNATSGLSLDTSVMGGLSIANVFSRSMMVSPGEVITRAPLPELPSLDILPSDLYLTRIEQELIAYPGREQVLSRWIGEYSSLLSVYDYIFLDTSPSLGLVNQNALLASDSVVLVTDVSSNGVEGAKMLMAYWESIREVFNKPDNIKALVLNNADRRIAYSSEIYDFLKDDELFSDIFIKTVIPSRVDLKDTEVSQRPINILHPGSESHLAFTSLVEDLFLKGAL